MEELAAGMSPRPLRNPRGYHATRVDPTGRLKLPARFVEYIRAQPDQILFATVVKDLAKIYVNGAWERELDKIPAEDADVKDRIARTAEALGGDVECDPQGRVTIPQEVRKFLNLGDDRAVQLRFSEDIITVYTKERFEAELKANLANNPIDLALAERRGFNVR
jgi:DNA-binding transcriptional regulator/RsmH inhibitor MraZ